MKNIIVALVALLMACFIASLPGDAANSTLNDFSFRICGNDQYILYWDSGIPIIPADWNNTRNTIPMRDTEVPCFQFVSENFDVLGADDPSVSFGAIMIIAYDNASVSNTTLMFNWNKAMLQGDMRSLQAHNITNATYDYKGQIIPYAIGDHPNIDYLTHRKIGPVNRKVYSTRVMLGNFAVGIIADAEHFYTILNSLELKTIQLPPVPC